MMNKDDLMCFGTLVILTVVGLSVLGYHWYDVKYGTDTNSTENKDYMEVDTVMPGDFVSVEYTGTLKDTGEVFYTTYKDVDESSTMPKLKGTYTYSPDPRKIYVGPSPIPGSPNSEPYTTYPTVAQGLVESLVGMKKGEVRTSLEVPPEKGFSSYTYENLDLYVEVPAVEEMSTGNFSSKFGIEPKDNMVVANKDWNWPAIVLSVDHTSDMVVVMNDPDMHGTYSYKDYSWNSTVVSMNSTTITLKHDLSKGDSITYKTFPGVVEWTDSHSIRIKYDTRNDARAGKTLLYLNIKVVKIYRMLD